VVDIRHFMERNAEFAAEDRIIGGRAPFGRQIWSQSQNRLDGEALLEDSAKGEDALDMEPDPSQPHHRSPWAPIWVRLRRIVRGSWRVDSIRLAGDKPPLRVAVEKATDRI